MMLQKLPGRAHEPVLWKLCFFIYAGIALIVFLNSTYPVLRDSIESTVSFQAAEGVGIWDAPRYHQYAEMVKTGGTEFILGLFGRREINLLPPAFLLLLLQNNPIFVFCFNVLVLYASLFSLLKYYASDDKCKIFFLTLINPFIFYLIPAINKEITSLASILFLATYIVSHRKKHVLLSLLFAFLARYQLVLIIVSFLFLKQVVSYRKRLIAIISYVCILSILVPRFDLLPETDIVKELQTASSTGLVPLLNDMAEKHYLFFLVFIPKILFNFYGNIYEASLEAFVSPYLYSSLLFLIITFLTFLKKHYRLQNDLYLLLLLYVIPMSVTPFIHHRYFLPIYPLLVILYVQRRKDLKGVSPL